MILTKRYVPEMGMTANIRFTVIALLDASLGRIGLFVSAVTAVICHWVLVHLMHDTRLHS